MGILTTKIYRDLRYSKGRSISIIIIVALSVALYGGLNLAYVNIQDTFEQTNQDNKIHSVRFILENYTNQDDIDLNGISNIEAWDYRLTEITTAQIESSEKVFTSVIYGVPGGREPRVNKFEGDYFDSALSQKVLLSRTFMEANTLEVGDMLQLPAIDVELEIGSSVFSPEYIYNVNPTSGLPDIQGMAAGWLTLEYAQQIFGRQNQVNQVLVLFPDEINQDTTARNLLTNQIASQLEQLGTKVSFIFLEEEAEQQMKNADVGALDDMARLFGLVVLLLALFAIYDNISKLIASQRNYIGTMRALGGDKWVITKHYTQMGTLLGFIGVIIGIPLGWLISSLMTVEYAALLGIPTPSTGFTISAFYEGLILIFGLSFIISLLSSLSASGINPREAMSSSFITAIYSSKPVLERIFSKIPGMNKPTSTIPIRNLFRYKRRTVITIFTFSVSLLLIIASFGFLDSFNHGISSNYENNEKYDLQVFFQPGVSMNPTDISNQLTTIIGIDVYEGFTYSTVEISSQGHSKAISMYGFEVDSQLRNIDIQNSEFDGLILGVNLAAQIGASKGSLVEIFGIPHEVAGLSSELLSDSAYLPMSQMQTEFGLGQNVTGIILTINNDFTEVEIKNALLETELPISLIISTDEVQKSIATLIQGLIALVGVFIFIGFVTVALFSFNTIVLDVMTRENEFINIRSLGGGRRKVMKIILLQSLFISLLGAAISIPLGYFITDWLIEGMIGDLMVLPTVISPSSFASAILASFIATLIGVWSAVRHVMKIRLADGMRNRVSN